MSLATCDSGHADIAYEDRTLAGRLIQCPLCEAKGEMSELVASLKGITDCAYSDGDPEEEVDTANEHWRDAIKDCLP
jgi:hypothetical protein